MLNVRAEKLGDVTVLHVRGQVVIGGASETLSEMLRAQIGACALVLDLAGVDRIDARGLGVLVELRQWTQSRGIEFRLNERQPIGPTGPVDHAPGHCVSNVVEREGKARSCITQTVEDWHDAVCAVRGRLT